MQACVWSYDHPDRLITCMLPGEILAQDRARTHSGRWLSQETLSHRSAGRGQIISLGKRAEVCGYKLCLVSKPKNSPCSASFSGIAIACGDRQQKGKLAFSWHVDFCS